MKYIIILISTLLVLSSCTEARFIAHIAKKIPMPGDISKTTGIFKIGNPYEIKGRTYYPKERYEFEQKGIASWYGPGFHGKLTANGETYNQYELTAAHRTLQMPSIIRVTNLENGRSLILRVNDRGPYSRNRILDVSDRGAELLGFKQQGTAKIKLEVLEEESHIVADAAKRGIDTSGMEVAFNNKKYPLEDMKKKLHLNEPQMISTAPSIESEILPEIKKMASQEINIDSLPIIKSKIFVQAGAFSVEENAIKLASNLSTIGKSEIYPVTINNQKFYRVRVGPFNKIDLADDALNKLVDSGNSQAMIIVEEM